jgi:NAD(P)-dependent dehydrogenase (short-subunit alcohol dehydrogenase family)
MDVNAFGSLAVSEALRDNVIASTQKKIIAITSGAGSITIAGGMPRGPYYYRMSKAAMDMGMRALGADLKSQGVVVALVAPGAVDTEMHTEFHSAYMPTRKYPVETPAEATAKMIAVIDKLDQTKAEQGINLHDGTIMPW